MSAEPLPARLNGAALSSEWAMAALQREFETADSLRIFSDHAMCAWRVLERQDRAAYDAMRAELHSGQRAVLERRLQLSDAATSPTDLPIELDLAALGARLPEPPLFIVPEWLPAGEVTLFAAHGGTGKSAISLYLGACIVLGRAWFGVPVEQRGVDVVSFEDRADVLHWRLHRVAQALGVTLVDLQAAGLRVFDATGCAAPWFTRQFGEAGLTAAFHDIAERVGGPGRVVIVDGSSDVFGGNENDRAETKAFVRALRRLIAPDGALLLLAHVDKAGLQRPSDAPGFSGSTGWHNGVRCRWFMFREDEGAETGNLVLEVRKSNLGRAGARMVLRFDEQAHVFARVDSEPMGGRLFQKVDEAEAIVQVIRGAWDAGDPIPAATAGTRTAHSVCEARDDFPASLKGKRGRARFHRALEQLRAAGAVQVAAWRNASRHSVQVLYVPK